LGIPEAIATNIVMALESERKKRENNSENLKEESKPGYSPRVGCLTLEG
jgi:hypothetical protein